MADSSVTIRRGVDVTPHPLVSVVIPAFNPKWLEEALASVRAQTLPGTEIIVVDDGSTVPVVPAETSDLILVRHDNAGPGGARNRAFSLAGGEFIALLDSDDRWRPSKLALQIAFLEQHPEAVVSTSNWCHFTAEGIGRFSVRFDATTRPGDTISLERLFYENCICCSAAVIRRTALVHTPGMVPHRRYGEDYGLWLRLVTIGTIGFLDDVLVEKRVHSDSLVQQTARDGSWFAQELAIYEEFLHEHAELRDRPFVAKALGRLYFQRAYQHRIRSEWVEARRAVRHSIRLDPYRGKAWMGLALATLRIR